MWLPDEEGFPADLDLSPIISDEHAPGPDWVSATGTGNWVVGEPLIDWLDRFGRQNGFIPNHDLPGYDERFDFVVQLRKRALSFQDAVVMESLKGRFGVQTITAYPIEARRADKMEQTLAAMKAGVPIIAQGVLWNEDDRIDGVPDMLVRSDILAELSGGIPFPSPLWGGSGRGSEDPHYVVVDIKDTDLHFLQDGGLSKRHLPAMVQCWLYNNALGKIQGFTPAASYVLGRQLFDRLGPVPQGSAHLKQQAEAAVAWVRRVRADGASWQVLLEPSIPELRPNLKAAHDGRWTSARRQIAIEQRDLTLLPYVRPSHRRLALEQGVSRWDDPRVSGRLLGLKDEQRRRLDAVLAANRLTGTDRLYPVAITTNRGDWVTPAAGDIYAWLESVNNERATVYMVAWGWRDSQGGWHCSHRIANDLSAESEAELLSTWKAELAEHAASIGLAAHSLRLFHWGVPTFAASHLPWFDVLENIIYKEPVAARGSFGFGLAEFAAALNQPGINEVTLHDLPALPTRALSAIAGASSAAAEAAHRQCSLEEVATMDRIAGYAEASCRSMSEVIGLLRRRAARAIRLAA